MTSDVINDAPTSLHRPITARPLVLAPGGTLGRYELREKLGQGTFGLVYVARDTELDRDVALKVLHPAHATNQDIVLRFLQEARATARIAHPGVVTLLDSGRVPTSLGETAYLTMELLQGASLTERLTRYTRLPLEHALEITRQIASALEAAHRAGVLHRDLKPDNIFLVPDPAVPAGERIKVLDFGLAKLGTNGHTVTNTVFGTPRYMSPEQCRSSGDIDQRSDVYALGCILFELLTGRTPFDGDLRMQLERHQRVPAPRAGSLVALPPALDDLIARMLEKDPAARPHDMAAVQRALHEAGAAIPAPPLLPPRGSAPLMLDPSGIELVAPRSPGAPPAGEPVFEAPKRRTIILAMAFVIAVGVSAALVSHAQPPGPAALVAPAP